MVLVVCELLAIGFFSRFGHRFPFPNPERYLATDEEIDGSIEFFDADLSWTTGQQTTLGERPRARDRGRPLIAAFGDSFTFGEDVVHSQTWCEQLAAMLDGDVYNFGVGAYGMDQALLHFERDFPRRPTEIAIFAFITHDITRNVSVYRKFQRPDGHFVLTKPRFVLDGEGLRLLPNPVASVDELRRRVTDRDELRQLGENDHQRGKDAEPVDAVVLRGRDQQASIPHGEQAVESRVVAVREEDEEVVAVGAPRDELDESG